MLTTSTTATAISEIVDDTLSLSSQLVTGEITLDEFNTLADVTAAASVSGGLNDAVAALPDSKATGSSGSADPSDSSGSGSSGSTDPTDSSGSGTSGGTSGGEGTSNQAPTFLNVDSFSIAENTTAAFTANATDAEGDTVTYSVSGGADATQFNINASSGVVTLIQRQITKHLPMPMKTGSMK